MAFVRGPIAAVITDQNGFALNLGAGSGSFTQGATPIVITDASGNSMTVGGPSSLGTSAVLGWSDAAFSRLGAGSIALGNGTQGDTSGGLTLGNALSIGVGGATISVNITSAGGVQFNGRINGMLGGNLAVQAWTNGACNNGTIDSGISRTGAGVLAVGNGTQGDTTGNLQLNQITKYNAIATAGQGISSVVGATSQRSESAADANVLTFTPPASAGSYRIRFVMSVSAASAATLGWTATWKDSNANAQAPTNLALVQTGVAAPALTFTTSAAGNYYGETQVDTDASATAIVVKLTFSGTSFTAKVSATIEKLI